MRRSFDSKTSLGFASGGGVLARALGHMRHAIASKLWRLALSTCSALNPALSLLRFRIFVPSEPVPRAGLCDSGGERQRRQHR